MSTVSGYTPVTNGGQYAGATSSVLTVSSLNVLNNGQQYRCMVSAGNCIDSSNVVYLTVTNPSGISEHGSLSEMKIYPNPANRWLNIEIADKAELNIYTLTGNRVFADCNENQKGEGYYLLNIWSLKDGVYVLEVKTSDGVTARRRFVKVSAF